MHIKFSLLNARLLSNMSSSYLIRAVHSPWAVVLVDKDRILDVPHHRVLEADTLHVSVARLGPRLDPEPVLSPAEHDRLHCYVLHSCLLLSSPQAPNAACKISASISYCLKSATRRLSDQLCYMTHR